MSESKVCTRCHIQQPLDQFPWTKDRRLRAGGRFASQCRRCQSEQACAWQKANRERAYEAQRRWRKANPEAFLRSVKQATQRRNAALKAQTPAWADMGKIAAVYEDARLLREAGFDAEVDHIVALQGVDACGLHVHENLQIVTRTENLQKRNHADEDAHYKPNAWGTFRGDS